MPSHVWVGNPLPTDPRPTGVHAQAYAFEVMVFDVRPSAVTYGGVALVFFSILAVGVVRWHAERNAARVQSGLGPAPTLSLGKMTAGGVAASGGFARLDTTEDCAPQLEGGDVGAGSGGASASGWGAPGGAVGAAGQPQRPSETAAAAGAGGDSESRSAKLLSSAF